MSVQIDDDELEYVGRIEELYFIYKALFIEVEETYNQMFTPAISGGRNAFDHLMRSLKTKLGRNDKDKAYLISNLRDTERHLYRAIYELLDVMVAWNKKAISDAIGKYSNETLTVICPRYFSEIKPFLLKMVSKAEEYRCKKDASSMNINEMILCREEVRELKKHVSALEVSIPELEKYEGQSRPQLEKKIDVMQKELKNGKRWTWIFGIATIIATALAVLAFII
jgi:uncharacterized protein with von Willebrand factor type A (vWA) domain